MNVKMDIINKIKNLDNSEKDFLLILLAFILVALFLFFSGIFNSTTIENESRIYLGYSDDEIELIELNLIQNLSCEYAHNYNSCYKLADTLIVNQNMCCIKMGMCC